MEEKEILSGLQDGSIKLHEIEKHTDKQTALKLRKEYIQTLTSKDLSSFDKYAFDPEKIYGRNCENVVGGISLPLGVAGPILVKGDNANGEYFIPMATTEGALVASVNRGCKILNMSGGVNSIAEYVGITRAPLYRLSSIKRAKEFKYWFAQNFDQIKKVGESTDKFLKVEDYKLFSNGKNVWIRFNFNTLDAMGMNMAVIATKAMSVWMEQNFADLKTIAISGNMCTDKKPAAINGILGRGRIVEAEAIIPADVVESQLMSSVDDVVAVNKNKIWLGSAMAGAMGFNAHTANMVAAIFIATGQDPAQVVDASIASTNMEKDGNDLYVHVRIPDLNVATFGGGTSLASQKSAQELILSNVSKILVENDDHNKTNKLAEIIGACVLAGELSLHAAFASNTFVKAHTDLGRNGNI